MFDQDLSVIAFVAVVNLHTLSDMQEPAKLHPVLHWGQQWANLHVTAIWQQAGELDERDASAVGSQGAATRHVLSQHIATNLDSNNQHKIKAIACYIHSELKLARQT